MTDSHDYFTKLMLSSDDLDKAEYTNAFIHAVIEFACYNRGKTIDLLLKIIKFCDYDHKKAIAVFDKEISRKATTDAHKYKLVFENDND